MAIRLLLMDRLEHLVNVTGLASVNGRGRGRRPPEPLTAWM